MSVAKVKYQPKKSTDFLGSRKKYRKSKVWIEGSGCYGDHGTLCTDGGRMPGLCAKSFLAAKTGSSVLAFAKNTGTLRQI
jgi:hypothetical protein